MLAHGGRAKDVCVLWCLSPLRPVPCRRVGAGPTHWQAVSLICHRAHDFAEQDDYWDLEVCGYRQKGGWLVWPRGFQEGPPLLGCCKGPGPPSTNSKPRIWSFHYGNLEECTI